MIKEAQNISKDPSRLLRNPELSFKMKKLCEMKKIHTMTFDYSINTFEGNVDLISHYAWIIQHYTQIMSHRIK